eukprot:gene17703-biopygen11545
MLGRSSQSSRGMPKLSWSDCAAGKYHCQVKVTPGARVVRLSQMLLEAVSRSAHQVKFEATLSDEPPAKSRRRRRALHRRRHRGRSGTAASALTSRQH